MSEPKTLTLKIPDRACQFLRFMRYFWHNRYPENPEELARFIYVMAVAELLNDITEDIQSVTDPFMDFLGATKEDVDLLKVK